MRTFAAVSLSFLLIACATTQSPSTDDSGAAKVDLSKPTIEVEQISSVGAAARNVTGGLPVQYRITVTNNSEQPITLTNVSLQSLGGGAYEVPPTSNGFKVAIAPKETGKTTMWVAANIPYASVAGANGPVTLRATLHFDSPKGKFQEVEVVNVASPSGV